MPPKRDPDPNSNPSLNMRAIFLYLNAVLLLISIISLMVFFTGGSTGLGAMILLLLLGLPVSALSAIAALLAARRAYGWSEMKAQTLANIPNWLRFGMALALALIFCGELALLLTLPLGAESPPLYMYLPVLTGTLATLACALLYSLAGSSQR